MTMPKRYYITNHRSNREGCPELIGHVVTEAKLPPFAVRRPVIKCCKVDLVCEHFTNTCEFCNADYNMSGHRLAPRSQWGEETGESWQDCY